MLFLQNKSKCKPRPWWKAVGHKPYVPASLEALELRNQLACSTWERLPMEAGANRRVQPGNLAGGLLAGSLSCCGPCRLRTQEAVGGVGWKSREKHTGRPWSWSRGSGAPGPGRRSGPLVPWSLELHLMPRRCTVSTFGNSSGCRNGNDGDAECIFLKCTRIQR